MQIIQIDNQEIESFINSQYGNDTKSLIDDFMIYIKERQSHIQFQENKAYFNQALKEIEAKEVELISQEAYNQDMKTFLKSL